MKNCNLLNRIVPQVFQDLRNFTNGSASNLGTKLLHGHISTIATPVIARRNQTTPMLPGSRKTNKSFFQGTARRGWVSAPPELKTGSSVAAPTPALIQPQCSLSLSRTRRNCLWSRWSNHSPNILKEPRGWIRYNWCSEATRRRPKSD